MDDINSTILLVGGFLIGVVVLHGLWVAWRSRKEPLRFDLAEMVETGEDHDELALLRGELPNGGARVVGTADEIQDPLRAPPRIDSTVDEVEPTAQRPVQEWDHQPVDEHVEERTDGSADANVGQPAGIALEENSEESPKENPVSSVEEPVDNEPSAEIVTELVDTTLEDADITIGPDDMPAEVVFDNDGRVEPVLGRFEIEPNERPDVVEARPEETFADEPSVATHEEAPDDAALETPGGFELPEPIEPPTQTSLDIDTKVAQEITLTPERSRRLRFNFGGNSRKSARGDKPEPAKKGRIERDFIAMWVTARHGGNLRGGEIIEALSRNSMRYTPSKVFCRLDPEDGSEQFQFVNGIEPGSFDLTAIEELETPRVLFLLTLPGPANPIAALEDMFEVARDVAMTLGADLLDDRLSAISGQTIEHYRNRISDFTRRSLSRRSETK